MTIGFVWIWIGRIEENLIIFSFIKNNLISTMNTTKMVAHKID